MKLAAQGFRRHREKNCVNNPFTTNWHSSYWGKGKKKGRKEAYGGVDDRRSRRNRLRAIQFKKRTVPRGTKKVLHFSSWKYPFVRGEIKIVLRKRPGRPEGRE